MVDLSIFRNVRVGARNLQFRLEVFNLLNRSGGSADNVDQTFTVNLGAKPANGTWNLRVRDAAAQDTFGLG